MKVYLLEMTDPHEGMKLFWEGTLIEAQFHRMRLSDGRPDATFDIQKVNAPSQKKNLIDFLNHYATSMNG